MTTMQLSDIGGRPVPLGRELGRGGQGAVYEVSGQPDAVAKVYLQRPSGEVVNKLTALAQASHPELLGVSAWPQTLLRDRSGQVHGFVMPLVDESEYHELHNLYRPSSRRQKFPTADWRLLVRVARNVSRAFGLLHHHGHLMGDVSARNILVSKQGIVRLIDTDSFQIRVGTTVYPCPVGTAEFTPPELQGQRFGSLVRTVEHDLFGLAALLFHLLFDGRHPYAGVHANRASLTPAESIAADKFAYSLQYNHGVTPPPMTMTLQHVHADLRSLFERAFSPRHQGRPTASEWERALATLEQNLTTCRKNADHKHDRRLPCPWCALLPANAQAATVKTGIPAGAKRLDVERELNRIWADLGAIPVPPPPPAPTLNVTPTPFPLPARPASAPPAPSLPSAPPATVPPPLAEPKVFSGQALFWALLLTLATLSNIAQGEFFGAMLTVVLALYAFSVNSAPNLKKRRERKLQELVKEQNRQYAAQVQQRQFQWKREVESLERQHALSVERVKSDYRLKLDLASREHAHEAKELERKIAEARSRQMAASAAKGYRDAIAQLNALREEIKRLDLKEHTAVQEAVNRQHKVMLERHLERFVLQPGDIPGIGASIIANLNARGIYTAKDITPDVRYIKGVGPKKQQELMDWRAMQEQFFQFTPAHLPAGALDAVRATYDQQRAAKLQQIEDRVAQLKKDLLSCKHREEAIGQDIQELQLKRARHEKTIEVIRQGATYLT
ncbi:protein kinase [Deinococcus sp. NW-56]|uniref:protein kinase domain-containing protein n=1 Tax=Deinococcus sp. NW-56 TaxID=2080419 RepID=UPI000CF3E103|nr:protein kinase [Deinococcus sp. NW-56]